MALYNRYSSLNIEDTMENYVWWSVAGIGLIIVEMMSGTLILLVLGLAAFAGALAAWLGASFAAQAVAAVALAAVGMIVASSLKKKKAAGDKSNDSLDIGHTVILESWVSEVDGVAKVRHRNATWDARVTGERTPGGTVFYIVATDGNTLHVSSHKPQS
jgi:membrane protein implicated in regulation of membrane protease activity